MKLSVLTRPLRNSSFEEMAKTVSEVGYDAVAMGTGGLCHSESDWFYAPKLIQDEKRLNEYKSILKAHNLEIASLACPANPVHPQKRVAKKMDGDLRASILLAKKLGMDTITTFSGCPGDHKGAMYPNWICYTWPNDALAVARYQWEDVLIPYWKDLANFARTNGVNRIALELHPNMSVYNVSTFKKLRDEAGPEIGVCIDPTHLIYTGCDVHDVVLELGESIYAVQGKDLHIRERNRMKNGWFGGPFCNFDENSWHFTIPPYGHGEVFWRRLCVVLRLVGYDRDICFEHDDMLTDGIEGMQKVYQFLSKIIYREKSSEFFWAHDVFKQVFAYLDDPQGAFGDNLPLPEIPGPPL